MLAVIALLAMGTQALAGTHTAQFKSVQLEVFNLAGKRVFNSGEVEGHAFQWRLQNDKGQVVANGVYLCIVTVRGFNGELIQSHLQKLVVLR